MSPEAAWKATLGELELQMTKATFNTWLKDARFVAREEGEYVIGVRNDYARDWLQNRLQDTILRTLAMVVGEPVKVRFVVGADEPAAPPVVSKNSRPLNGLSKAGEAAASPHNSPFNSYYTFATFVVGHSNRLAHAAALAVAERPGQTYNPLFIYGGVGLGKTHLLHAIGHKSWQSGRAVCYVSSETFTNDLIQSIRGQKTAEFREKYRTPDVLLIDDIQFIAGKESTQEELFHTFNDLHSRGKQVVLSSDRPPKAMVTLEERLQSRFEWGLMADIQMPDVETRMAILQAKAEESSVPVPRSVIEIIAHTVRNNIRELEGALNKVIAYSRLTGQAIDAELLNVALADLIRRPEKVHVEQVVTAVCSHYQVTRDDLCSSSRNRAVAFPRQIAMYLARTETDASFPQIGLTLGSRDHTTILHGYEKIAGLLETDAAVRREVLQIKASLYS
ncbi:MAG: chromosomal replication initiator protein DnaA [Chloroflexota bacterium]